MRLKKLELNGFKSFAKKTELLFDSPITSIVGPNGSGKSNVAEAFRWVLGEQSLKSLRGKRGEDLIFNGGHLASRLNKASVSVVFDNSNKELDVDFEEVSIKRTVYRDGSNEYSINNSVVRLKDIIELLSTVSLGPSGHHIISQGEADRILNAGLKERREIVEEALGLKIYHWKISESQKKLNKTEENIKQVQSLRREISPHIKFLKKQVEKIEQADALRQELKSICLEYFKRESDYIKESRELLIKQRSEPNHRLEEVVEKLSKLSTVVNKPDAQTEQVQVEISSLENNLKKLSIQKDELSRKLGRLEGMIEIQAEQKNTVSDDESVVPLKEIYSFRDFIDSVSVLSGTELVEKVKEQINRLIDLYSRNKNQGQENKLKDLVEEKDSLLSQIKSLKETELEVESKLAVLKQSLEQKREESRGAERELFELKAEKSKLDSKLFEISSELNRLESLDQEMKQEIAQTVPLVDREILAYDNQSYSGEEDSREMQEKRHKQIERIKIRLEDMGVDRVDVLEEYKEVTGRDTFLENELADLEKSKESLMQVVSDLTEKLSIEFNEGVKKINNQFSDFFSLMFGGGSASLKVISVKAKKRKSAMLDMNIDDFVPDETEEAEEGIDIAVNLPRKKIKGLEMLSGGERALTSIALLFAMSQVNPPPFLILDETDAALDEANSRKYGDMISNLSKHSQLILITHNRETMSRAGVLYGVTMGSDGISKLLSIKLEQAENYAK